MANVGQRQEPTFPGARCMRCGAPCGIAPRCVRRVRSGRGWSRGEAWRRRQQRANTGRGQARRKRRREVEALTGFAARRTEDEGRSRRSHERRYGRGEVAVAGRKGLARQGPYGRRGADGARERTGRPVSCAFPALARSPPRWGGWSGASWAARRRGGCATRPRRWASSRRAGRTRR